MAQNQKVSTMPVQAASMVALRAEEWRRSRYFAVFAAGLAGTIGVMVWFLPGDDTAKHLTWVSNVGVILTGVHFALSVSQSEDYTPNRTLVWLITCALSVTAFCYYSGWYSPSIAFYVFGIYFLSLGSSLRVSAILYASCTIGMGGGMLLEALGVIPAVGMVSGDDICWEFKLAFAILMHLLLASTFVFGRVSERATTKAVTNMERALRRVGERDAQLEEAQLALRVHLGVGRLTGTTISDWLIGDVIGRGGNGEVYAAHHVDTKLPAAVKFLRAELADDVYSLKRLMREAQIIADIDSQNTVKVFDTGDGSSGPPYIAMEFLEGRDLGAILRDRGRLPTTEVLDLIEQVADMLSLAHARDVVHRDLKPQNLFLVDQGDDLGIWKVLDFGVSKVGENTTTLTQDILIGTPAYMAPEQAGGKSVDQRADVFSLAAIAYRAITGHPAFRGTDVATILFQGHRAALAPGEPYRAERLHSHIQRVQGRAAGGR